MRSTQTIEVETKIHSDAQYVDQTLNQCIPLYLPVSWQLFKKVIWQIVKVSVSALI